MSLLLLSHNLTSGIVPIGGWCVVFNVFACIVLIFTDNGQCASGYKLSNSSTRKAEIFSKVLAVANR